MQLAEEKSKWRNGGEAVGSCVGQASQSPRRIRRGNMADEESRKATRSALYAAIFHRHRKTILVLGSFLRILRNGQANNYGSIK